MATHVFADFSGGFKGNLDLAKVPNNMFDARNMLVYKDGSLGPRPGLRAFALGRTVADAVYACDTQQNGFYTSKNKLVYLEKNPGVSTGTMRTADTSGAPSPTASFSTTKLPPLGWPAIIRHKTSGTNYIHIPGNVYSGDGGTYQYQNTGATDKMTDASVTGVPYGARMVRSEWQSMRIYYSNANDFYTWPATSYIDLVSPQADTSSLGGVVFIDEQKNHLTIVDSYGRWFILTGVPGVNDTLRLVATDLVQPPPYGISSFVTAGKDIYALSPVNDFPVRFDGVNLEQLTYLSMSPADPKESYAANYDFAHNAIKAFLGADSSSPFFARRSDGAMLGLNNGAWGLHTFGVSTSAAWCSDGRGLVYGFSTFMSGASPPQTAHVMDLSINRPAFTSDLNAQPGDLSNTPLNAWVTLAEFWSESSDPIRVSEVVVDFIRYNTGVNNNGFNVKVEALGRGGSGVGNGTQTQVWTDPGSNSTTAGVADRVRVPFGNQGAGAGWRVSVEAVVGVKLRQIIVNDTEDSSNRRPF